MLEFLPAHSGVRGLISPALTLLVQKIIGEDVWDHPLKYYSREEGSSMRDN